MPITKTFVIPLDRVYVDLAKICMYKCSFIMQEIRAPESARSAGIETWSLCQLVYLVTLIGPDGEDDSTNESLWVLGLVVDGLITAAGLAQTI